MSDVRNFAAKEHRAIMDSLKYVPAAHQAAALRALDLSFAIVYLAAHRSIFEQLICLPGKLTKADCCEIIDLASKQQEVVVECAGQALKEALATDASLTKEP